MTEHAQIVNMVNAALEEARIPKGRRLYVDFKAAFYVAVKVVRGKAGASIGEKYIAYGAVVEWVGGKVGNPSLFWEDFLYEVS